MMETSKDQSQVVVQPYVNLVIWKVPGKSAALASRGAAVESAARPALRMIEERMVEIGMCDECELEGCERHGLRGRGSCQ